MVLVERNESRHRPAVDAIRCAKPFVTRKNDRDDDEAIGEAAGEGLHKYRV
jgi:hypothetical protein